jgi:STE24 endopeptidase
MTPHPNPYFWFILVAVLADFLLGRVVSWLNLRASRRGVPQELAGVYDDAEYRRSQAYTRARARLSMVSASVGLAVLLGFWLLGGFAWLDGVARVVASSWGWLAGWRPVSTGLIFLGALGLGSSLLSLPFSAWGTFVLEERFGFNRTTLRTFLLDLAKGLALSVVLGAPLVAAVLWLFEAAGELAWLGCWAVVSLYTLLVQWLGPRFILPLFHEYRPLPEGELRDAVTRLVESQGFDLAGLFVIDASRRSTKANAFFTGFGRTKRLALFDTLAEKLTVPEVVVVVAHEIGHFKRRHVLKGTALGVLHSGVLLFLLSIFLDQPGLYRAFGIEQQPVYAGLVFFAFLYTPVGRVLSIALNALSRRYEYQADRFAARATGRPEDLATAVTKLAADHLTNLTPHPLKVMLDHSHPPLRDRLAALRSLASTA